MDFSALDGSERSVSRSGHFNSGEGANDIPLIGELNMVAKGKIIVRVKSISIFYFFIFLSLMS
jgi:hypothetical protein